MDLEQYAKFRPVAKTADETPKASSLEKQKPVDEKEVHGFFTIELMVGPQTSWLNAVGSRDWEERESNSVGDKKKRAYPVMRFWEVQNVPGSVVNGLIQRGNEWLASNMVKAEDDGWLNRLLFVTSVKKQVGYTPPVADFSTGLLSMNLIKAAVESEVSAALSRIAAEQGSFPGNKTPSGKS